jgi:hypothetical protein
MQGSRPYRSRSSHLRGFAQPERDSELYAHAKPCKRLKLAPEMIAGSGGAYSAFKTRPRYFEGRAGLEHLARQLEFVRQT